MIGSVLRVNRYRVARVYSPHGGSLHFARSSPTGQIILRLERLQENFCDAIAFVCDYERRTYEAKVGTPRPHSQVIYNGINEAEFTPVSLEPQATDFLFIGMMRDMKGPDVFIDAFLRTERRIGRPLTAMMIGDGPDEDKYRAMISELGLDRRMQMLPAMPARKAFALARTIVVPSRAEAMPYIVLEALAAGKPVIASRVGGIPEVLGESSEALAIPGDAQDLSSIMTAAATQPDWRIRTMPKPSAFKSVFSAQVMARDMLGLYRDALQTGNGKPA